MRFERRIPVALALACAALLGAGTPAAGGDGPDSPCRTSPCKARLLVGYERTKWRSVETFYPRNEAVRAQLRVNGRKLRFDGSFGPGGCRWRYLGSGLVVVVKVCGDVTPIRVRADRFKGKRSSLSVAYQAAPAVRGDA